MENQGTAVDQRRSLSYQIGYDTGFKDGFNKGLEETHTIVNLTPQPTQILLLKDSELFNVLRESLNQMLVNEKARLTEENDKLKASLESALDGEHSLAKDLVCAGNRIQELSGKVARMQAVVDAAEVLLRDFCAYCPPHKRENINVCENWCGIRSKYILRKALAELEAEHDNSL